MPLLIETDGCFYFENVRTKITLEETIIFKVSMRQKKKR